MGGVYEDLTLDELLERCLGVYTQNNNESLNLLICTYVSNIYCGKDTVEIANFWAICILNEEFYSVLQIMAF